MKDEKINKLFTSENLNEKIESKNRKILFPVDNCPAHKVTFLYSHIKFFFLPPNTTSIFRPRDLEIIRSLSVNLEKKLIGRVIHMIDNNLSL